MTTWLHQFWAEWGTVIITVGVPMAINEALGMLPDRWVKYKGAIRGIINAVRNAKAKGGK